MAWKPKLNVVCNRCGKPRGLTHTCVSNSSRSTKPKLKASFGKCSRCGKAFDGNPLAHTCRPKSDFKRRKSAWERRQKSGKRQGDRHDYQACADKDCPRPLCMAFKTGWKGGYDSGYEDGWPLGYEQGWEDGSRRRA